MPRDSALLYQSVATGFHLCCATPRDQVTELIARMTEGIDDLRPAVPFSLLPHRSYLSRYMTENTRTAKPGRTANRVPEVTTTSPATGTSGTSSTSRATDVTDVSPYTVDSPAGTPAELQDLLRTALGVEGLHYVAHYAAGVPTCTADIFRHRALSSHFGTSTTPQQRRDKYSLLGQLLPGVTRRMDTSLHALLEGRIHQIVLNVDQGAVYFQQLKDGHYLVAVSLDHSRLAEADRHLERLAADLARE
ncbi:hypothetical protein [Streptomyces djakartensis]|uniref:hypothetical protein n=1 Tax=Streptomyces djakartensis TaxID=68193 RepID=UPI00167C52B7|nr:hypothetical protein [Streptomyces djakartensis]